jgi:hypothetical protein
MISINKLINSIFYMGLLMKKFILAIPIGLMLVVGAVATIGVSSAFAQSANDKSGTISSTQNGANGKPEWKVSGTWTFTGLDSKSPKFDAAFGMEMLNGSAKHKHTINDFKLVGNPAKSSDGTVYNGTATISLKKGPVNSVPVAIKITNSGDFSLKVDPKLTGNHFGDNPIQGKVKA